MDAASISIFENDMALLRIDVNLEEDEIADLNIVVNDHSAVAIEYMRLSFDS